MENTLISFSVEEKNISMLFYIFSRVEKRASDRRKRQTTNESGKRTESNDHLKKKQPVEQASEYISNEREREELDAGSEHSRERSSKLNETIYISEIS